MAPPLFWIDVVAYTLTTLVAVSLLLVVLGAGARRPLNASFGLLMVAASLWAGTSVILRSILWLEVGNPQLLMEVSTLAFALMGPPLLLFGSIYTRAERRGPYVAALAALVLTGLVSIPLFRHEMVTNVRMGPNGMVNWDRSLSGMIMSAPLSASALFVVALLRRRRYELREPYLPIGIVILVIGGLLFSLLRPPFPTLSITVLASVSIMGYAVLVRQLFNPLHELTDRLDELRAFNENIVQSLEGGILIEDEAGRITFANPKIGELLECPPEELIGQPWTSIVAPQQDAQLREKTIRRPRTVARRYETLLQTREEREIPVIISARPLFEEGRFTGVLSVLTDITERKQVEELLERERETFFSILQKAPYGVLLIDKDERCLYVNTEFTKITGYVLEDVPNMSVWFQKAYPDPDYRQKVIDTWQGDTAQRISRVFNVTCKDGEVDKEVEFRPTLLDDGRAILVLSDITERKQREAERGRLLAALKRRTTQLLTAAEVSRPASMILDPEELMEHVVNLIEERFDFYYAGLFLLDKSKEYAVLRAGTGAAGQQMIEADHRLRVGGESMIGQCVEDGEARIASDVGRESMHLYNLYLPETRSEMALPLVSRGKCIGALTVQSAELGTFSEEDVAALQAMADHLAIAIQNARLYNAAQREIVERKRVEERLRRRNRELALLNRASQALISTLDLDHVLITVLDEVRHIMDVTACSIWLVDPETEEMVCQQATGPKRDTVQDWRLEPGEGLVGWVMRNGQSLIVPDASVDERYFAGVEQHTGLDLRSILSLPLRIKEEIIGVLQAVDSEANRFDAVHLALLEPLAATAAMAIENARLYEQAHRDAATKSVLLREVNHRVKNNLSAIIGLLHAARRRTEVRDQQAYQSVMKDLINRVRGLVTVHGLLSTSEWGPLPLSQLTAEVIRSSIRTLSKEEHISVDVPPSSVCVTADQAHDLTLVINELTTNTVKHGLREQEAHIAISAGREGDTVRLEFRDNGPGYPQEALEVGGDNVGLDLIDKIVRRNLRGTLSLHNDRGAVAVIRFKSGIQTEGEEKT